MASTSPPSIHLLKMPSLWFRPIQLLIIPPPDCQESPLFLGYFHLLWQLPPTHPWESSRNALEHSMMTSFLLEHSMMSSFCLECSMTAFCIPECSMMSSFLPKCSMTSSFFQDVP